MRLPLSVLFSLLSLHNRIDGIPINPSSHQLDKFPEYLRSEHDFSFEVPLVTTSLELDVDTETSRAARIHLLESIIHGGSKEESEHINQRYPEIRSGWYAGKPRKDCLNDNNKRLGDQATSKNAGKRQRK